MSEKFYLTTAIDYVNAKPHLGTAYEKVAADCVARAHRLLGRDVLFVMGNDEHSTKVETSAREMGLEPPAYADRMEAEFRGAWKRLNISFDDFIRTSQPRHHAAVDELLRRIRENGFVRKGKYAGWYCDGCEAFYTEKDLVDGKCPNHDIEPEWLEEENWFFELSRFRDRLVEHIETNPGFIRPDTRRNEILSFLRQGLEDVSISRSGGRWGIPFPGDPDHVVYVWFDALINYVSAVGFGTDPEKFEKWWPADCHVIGKDITRFHCIIWPAMLMAADLPLPRCVFGHGFVYHSGRKMSKSLGNIVAPLDVVNVTGADPLRYFLLREITFGKDGDFTWDAFIGRYNADLANDLGNLVQRTTDMTVKFAGGTIDAGEGGEGDVTGLREAAVRAVETAARAYEALDLSEALAAVWSLVRRSNQAIQEARPWELAKDDARREELAGVLSELLEAIRVVAVLAEPAVPQTAARILARLGLDGAEGTAWSEAAAWRGRPGWSVQRGEPIFPRLEVPERERAEPQSGSKRTAKKSKGRADANASPAKQIDLDVFRDVRLVVATVREAERVAGAHRLLKLTLDVGSEERQVVAGIAEHFPPADLEGKQVVLVANLRPAKIRGIESQGMILVAQSGGRMALLGPQVEIDPGATIS